MKVFPFVFFQFVAAARIRRAVVNQHLGKHNRSDDTHQGSAECKANSGCEQLEGNCCPADDGTLLDCCPAACKANSACAHLPGACCPTSDGVMLDCCSSDTVDAVEIYASSSDLSNDKEHGEFLLNATAAKEEFLAEHNKFRCMHGAGPLTWNDKMAKNAATWIESCCKSGLKHSEYMSWDPGAMENLATGMGSAADAVKAWYSEVKDCGKMPGCGGQFSKKTGHFTCVVWKAQTEMGCAVNPTGGVNGAPVYACHYKGPEQKDWCNMAGQFEKNVLEKSKSEDECGR